jgi:ribosomal 30S subunit maturation factor RimM
MTEAAPPASFPHRIGRVAKPHGLDGALAGSLFRPRPVTPTELEGRTLATPAWLALTRADGTETPFRLRRYRFLDGTRVVLHMDGIEDRTAAEAWTGAFVDVDPRSRPPGITDGFDAWIGFEVVDHETDRTLGTVDALRDYGAHPILAVGDPPVLIPAVDAFVAEVRSDPPPGQIRVRLLPGLIDANAPSSGGSETSA